MVLVLLSTLYWNTVGGCSIPPLTVVGTVVACLDGEYGLRTLVLFHKQVVRFSPTSTRSGGPGHTSGRSHGPSVREFLTSIFVKINSFENRVPPYSLSLIRIPSCFQKVSLLWKRNKKNKKRLYQGS